MKTKTILIILALTFIMGIAIAEAVTFAQKVIIDNSKTSNTIKPTETITFDCDGKLMEVTGIEPDGNYDLQDMRTLTLNAGCVGIVTDIRDSKGEYFESIGNYVGFDAEKKKIEECRLQEDDYNSKTKECIDIPITPTD